jgi:ribosome maturation factor RimP
MSQVLEQIRAAADRVAASHGLEVVEVEFTGGGKHRALRVFLEKNAEGRARLIEAARAADEASQESAEAGAAENATPAALPKGVPLEHLSGLTHEDCAVFSHDFGTLLDVEDTVPGAEYTLEVSSPGLERKLTRAEEYHRFLGSVAKLQTFTPVNSNRVFTGRITAFDGHLITLDLAAIKQKGKAKKSALATSSQDVQIELANVEKASLVVEI